MNTVSKEFLISRLGDLSTLLNKPDQFFAINARGEFVISVKLPDGRTEYEEVLFPLIDFEKGYLKERIDLNVPASTTNRRMDFCNSIECILNSDNPNDGKLTIFDYEYNLPGPLSSYRTIPQVGLTYHGLTISTTPYGKEVHHTIDTPEGFMTLQFYRRARSDYTSLYEVSESDMAIYTKALDAFMELYHMLIDFANQYVVARTQEDLDQRSDKRNRAFIRGNDKLTRNSLYGGFGSRPGSFNIS